MSIYFVGDTIFIKTEEDFRQKARVLAVKEIEGRKVYLVEYTFDGFSYVGETLDRTQTRCTRLGQHRTLAEARQMLGW